MVERQLRGKMASMLHREHIGIEIGNPLLALLCDPERNASPRLKGLRMSQMGHQRWFCGVPRRARYSALSGLSSDIVRGLRRAIVDIPPKAQALAARNLCRERLPN